MLCLTSRAWETMTIGQLLGDGAVGSGRAKEYGQPLSRLPTLKVGASADIVSADPPPKQRHLTHSIL